MSALVACPIASRSFIATKQQMCSTSGRFAMGPAKMPQRMGVAAQAYKVTLMDNGHTHTLEVEEGDNILAACFDAGIEVPHDCTMGTCCRCAARLISGDMDLNAGMIEPEVMEKGYVLLCTALPTSDVVVQTIDENELLNEVLNG